jgi:hypothetical protein
VAGRLPLASSLPGGAAQHSAWVGQPDWLRFGYAAACSHARASAAVPRVGLSWLRRWSTWCPPRLSFYLAHKAPAVFHCLSRLDQRPGHSEDRTSPCPALLLADTDETTRVCPLPAVHVTPHLPWLVDCSTFSHLSLLIEATHLHLLGHSCALLHDHARRRATPLSSLLLAKPELRSTNSPLQRIA